MFLIKTAKNLREYILDNTKKFPHFDNFLNYYSYAFITRSRFRSLLFVLFLIITIEIIIYFLLRQKSNTYIPIVMCLVLIYSLYIVERSANGLGLDHGSKIGMQLIENNETLESRFKSFLIAKDSYVHYFMRFWNRFLRKNAVNENVDEVDVHLDGVLNRFTKNSKGDYDDTPRDIKKTAIYKMKKKDESKTKNLKDLSSNLTNTMQNNGNSDNDKDVKPEKHRNENSKIQHLSKSKLTNPEINKTKILKNKLIHINEKTNKQDSSINNGKTNGKHNSSMKNNTKTKIDEYKKQENKKAIKITKQHVMFLDAKINTDTKFQKKDEKENLPKTNNNLKNEKITDAVSKNNNKLKDSNQNANNIDSSSGEEIKAETEKKQNYFIKLQNLIIKKNIFEQRFTFFSDDANNTKDKMDKYFLQLKSDFLDFLIMSRNIKNELIGLDVDLNHHLFDMNAIEDALYQKFYVFDKENKEVKENIFENIEANEYSKAIAFFEKETIVDLRAKDPLTKGVNKFYNSMIKQEEKIKKNQVQPADKEIENMEKLFKWLKFLFTWQCLFAFTFVVSCIGDMQRLNYYVRVFMIPILILNLFVSIHLLLMGQIFHEKCLTKNISTCSKKKDLSVDDIVYQINAVLSLDENTFDAVETTEAEFNRLSSEYKRLSKNLEIYLIRNAYNHINNAIQPIKSMFTNIKFIKNDFDIIMKKKVNKKEYFFLMSRIEILFESMIELFRNPNFGAVIGFYHNAIELKLEFEREKEAFSNMIRDFELDDAKKMKAAKRNICKSDIIKTCRASEIFDEMFFITLVCGSFFTLLLCV